MTAQDIAEGLSDRLAVVFGRRLFQRCGDDFEGLAESSDQRLTRTRGQRDGFSVTRDTTKGEVRRLLHLQRPPERTPNLPDQCIHRLETSFFHPFTALFVFVFAVVLVELHGQVSIALLDFADQGVEGIGPNAFIVVLEIIRIGKKIVRLALQVVERRGDREVARRRHGEVDTERSTIL